MSTPDNEILANDPYTTGDTNKFLTAIKIALGYKTLGACPPGPVGGDTVKSFSQNFITGTKFKKAGSWYSPRNQTARLCLYYAGEPKRQMSYLGHAYPKFTVDAKDPEKVFGGFSLSTSEGCNNSSTLSNFLYTAPLYLDGRDNAAKTPYHSVFVRQDACPTWAKLLGGDLNANCKGPYMFTCAQESKRVVDCCMGEASGVACRSDQMPRSGFCDSYMQTYCKTHKDEPKCACLSPVPDEVAKKFGISTGVECWYGPCADHISDTDASKRSYMTKAQMDRSGAGKSCPPNQIVDCTSIGNITNVSGKFNFVDANNQKCGIYNAPPPPGSGPAEPPASQTQVRVTNDAGSTTRDTPGEIEKAPVGKAAPPKPATPAGSDKTMKILMLLGAGFVLLVIVVAIVLMMSE